MDFDVARLHGRRSDARWNRMAVGDLLERVTWSHPDKEAIVGWEGAFGSPEYARVTYRTADETANRVANALLAAGLDRGDRVLLFCENSVEALLSMIGIAKAGLVCAPVNPIMAPDVVAWAIDHVDARFAVVDAVLWPKAQEAFATARLSPAVSITACATDPASPARPCTARLRSPPATTETRRPPGRPSRTAGFTLATAAPTTRMGCR
jgi:acyl-CoA synthetase (AMP-forming)/AMP-acid ligase II